MASGHSKKKALRERYIFGVFDIESHKQVFNIKFSVLHLLLGLAGFLIVVVTSVVLTVIYTPLRELVPGYPNAQTRQVMMENALRADSLEKVIHLWEIHLVNLQRVLAGQAPMAPEEILPKGQGPDIPEFTVGGRSREDSLLRAGAELREQQSRSSISGSNLHIEGLHFFPPVRGLITSGFSPAENHYAIDIVAPENSVIYAVLDGTVNFASWTEEFGYVLQIQHENNLLSIYKHCSQLFKKVGDPVTAGSAVAIIGSHGTYSTGFHLHFELWHKGVPLDPADYINF
ncbi:MAG: M23 family metallopeptidase [Bacteroidales bacterium]|jgi:murein DD-endopeptidase MepM/ murein hydrolase activator NlpD|nr:M23 family metallopeptidase [Bacteroidales bacterium]MDD2823576.1 M23 family metallopeptidase [Bacteroidales bacterium]MDD3100669.1 M23 family metallopeptidase [Bacteroidales bacterium]MDD3639586.1 M23 family metallopeptidase [Bacteroidales bacterium]MDD3944284.1 M23 family metallopeptidase [Bacteroidales bacterium]